MLRSMGTSTRTWAATAMLSISVQVSGADLNALSLHDLRGSSVTLEELAADQTVLVVAAVGVDCVIANLYLPRLIELQRRYPSDRVQFIAVYPNFNEDVNEIAAHAYERDVPFPVYKDRGQAVCRELGLSRTPSVAVVDPQGRIRYAGRIDDQYGLGHRKPAPGRTELIDALEAVLSEKEVKQVRREADGCLFDEAYAGSSHADREYHRDIAPLIESHCFPCHTPGNVAPFSLTTYREVKRRSELIREVVMERRMPPWHADSRYGEFVDDRRLAEDQIATLLSWLDQGAVEGAAPEEPAVAPDVSSPWQIGTPDLVFTLPEPVHIPAEGIMPYLYYEVPTGLTEDRWVEAAEVKPTALREAHHMVVYINNSEWGDRGEPTLFAGWLPGFRPAKCPEDSGFLLPKHSTLVFELHYTPSGLAQVDRTSVGIRFAKEPPKHRIRVNALRNYQISIPPNAPHHHQTFTWEVPGDIRVLSLMPHMHWRGKAFSYRALFPDGTEETILSVPRFDFSWQTVYSFKEPLRLPKGTRIQCDAHWDNSRFNANNPAPNRRINFGYQVHQEMMDGWMAYIEDRPE